MFGPGENSFKKKAGKRVLPENLNKHARKRRTGLWKGRPGTREGEQVVGTRLTRRRAKRSAVSAGSPTSAHEVAA